MGSSREMFDELLGDVDALGAGYLEKSLEEIASGMSCFGELPEWRTWYHYLLWRLIPRSHEGVILELLITAFFTLYPNGIYRSPYPQFEDDALQTLGCCVISSPYENTTDSFYASMFFCLKYLPAHRVPDWFSSALSEQSPQWRTQIMVWLVSANELLQGEKHWPSEMIADQNPSIDWEWSHCLRPTLATLDESGATPVESFLPQASREVVLAMACEYFTPEVYWSWINSIMMDSDLALKLRGVAATFVSLYMKDRPVELFPPQPPRIWMPPASA